MIYAFNLIRLQIKFLYAIKNLYLNEVSNYFFVILFETLYFNAIY